MALKRYQIKEDSDEWLTLINQLDRFRTKIHYKQDSEFMHNHALLVISGIGKETDSLDNFIEAIQFINKTLSKYYRGYKFYTVNHGIGLRIDIKK